jgi:hypothetical protein
MEMMRERAPDQIATLAKAIRTRPSSIGTRIDKLAGGRRHLGELGADRSRLKVALDAVMERGDLAATPGGAPAREEVESLIEAAW